MGRKHRLHEPGAAFHIVSRTQGHHPWFTDDIKDDVANDLLTGVASAGARPIAFAVMDNHFHLILLQGTNSLGWTMQSIMRRIALRVQRRHGLQGHVFERRYRAKQCQDSEYLPNAILYVHRNPVKARICTTASDYQWSSAARYERKTIPGLVAVDVGLRAFGECSNMDELHDQYVGRLAAVPDEKLDGYWTWFWQAIRRSKQTRPTAFFPAVKHVDRAAVRDLRDVAVKILRSIDASVDIELVRSRYGGRKLASLRRELIAALVQRDYAGCRIAAYLRISEASVSRVRSAMRWSAIQDMPESVKLEDGKQVR